MLSPQQQCDTVRSADTSSQAPLHRGMEAATTASPHVNDSSLVHPSEDMYNEDGAVLFIIVVLLMYGSSIVFFIGYSVKSSTNTKQGRIDREIERYICEEFSDCTAYRKQQVSFRCLYQSIIAYNLRKRRIGWLRSKRVYLKHWYRVASEIINNVIYQPASQPQIIL